MLGKKPPLLVTVSTAILLIGAGVTTYIGLRWQLSQLRGLPTGVRAVPQSAVAAVTLSTDPEQWQQLRQFGTPETQASFDKQLAQWRDRWLGQYGIVFAEDIAPWVGMEATIAWVPGSEAISGNQSGEVVIGNQRRMVLLPIADPEAAQLAAENLPLEEATEASLEYRGVALNEFSPSSGDGTETLLVGLLGTRLLLIAEDENVAQQAIDAYKGGKNIADISGYRRSFEHIGVSQAFGKLYFNVPAITQLLAQSAQPTLSNAVIESFQDSRGIAATATLESQGIQIKSTSWFGAGSDRAYVDTNVASQLPQYLPRDTLLFVSGGNFQQFWQDLTERRNWGALTALTPDNLSLALQSTTGLSLEDDLLPWMGGEFALALVSPDQDSSAPGETALPNPSLVSLIQVSDRPRAERAFDRLDEVVKNRYRFTITNDPEGEIDLVRWTSPFESTMLSRGWLDSSVAFLTVGMGTDQAIVPQPRRPLAKAPLFQLTTGNAPSSNNGHFFINLEALNQTNDNLFLPALPAENQAFLNAIQALGVTATVLDEQRLRYDLYLALKRGNRPGPLPSKGAQPEPSETTPQEETSPGATENPDTGEATPAEETGEATATPEPAAEPQTEENPTN